MVRGTGLVLARNAIYNLLTQAGVVVVTVVSIPIIVRALGEEVFGLLTMAWLVVGYFSILDLGVGQASVKFLSEKIAQGNLTEANTTVWISVGVSIVVGLLTAALMIAAVPLLLNHVFNVPPNLRSLAQTCFYTAAFAIPFVLLQGAFRSVPMAIQRFDLTNLVQAASGLLQWGGSLVLIVLGKGLFEIIVLTVIIRILGALVSYQIALQVFPELSLGRLSNVRGVYPKLIKFGGWLSISQIVSPVTRYLDRVLIASLYSLQAFTFYSVPYEAISRLQLIPSSLSTTLFPAVAERDTTRPADGAAIDMLYTRALNMMMLVMVPISAMLIAFSSEILQLWLGGDFPGRSSTVFRILALAASVHAAAYIPVALLQGVGRPDITGKLNLLEIPAYVILCFILIPLYGIEGAAWAWCIRLVLLTASLVWFASRSLGRSLSQLFTPKLLRGVAITAATSTGIVLVAFLHGSLPLRVFVLCFVALVYAAGVWRYCFDAAEREVFTRLILRRP